VKTAVILAGGLGLRLNPYTLTLPKPLLPLNGMPILEIILYQLKSEKFERVIISVGYLADLIKAYVKDGAKFGLQISYIEEKTPMGTAGSLSLIEYLPENFIVLNGDVLTKFNFTSLISNLEKNKADATVCLIKSNVKIDYGTVVLDEHGLISEYKEKPKIEFLMSSGIYAIKRESLKILGPEKTDMPDFLTNLKLSGGKVMGLITDSYWQDIGKHEDYLQASIDFEKNTQEFLRNYA
jgi:NDP-sugar pyrophosphorylase family protein